MGMWYVVVTYLRVLFWQCCMMDSLKALDSAAAEVRCWRNRLHELLWVLRVYYRKPPQVLWS